MRWPISARLWVAALAVVATLSVGTNAYLLLLREDAPAYVEPKQLAELARIHFPNEFASSTNPDNLALAFILNRQNRVQSKAVAFLQQGESLDVTLQRTFPALRPSPQATLGSICFPAEAGIHGKFCVIYIVPNAL